MIRRARGLILLALLAAAACAPSAVVVVSPSYDPSRVKSVALTSFTDFPGASGSGDVALNSFEKYLLQAGYRVVDAAQADAVAAGALTDYTGSRDETVMVDIPQTQSEPVYGQATTTTRVPDEGRQGRGERRGGGGEVVTQTTQDVVVGYNTTQTDQIVPETQTVPAHVAMNVRLLDAKTSELLWTVSSSASGDDLASATEAASAAAMQAVAKKLKKIK
ncbi:MAG: hypothetical protein ACHQ2Z_07805 [Elusimicrobiota bacterium]